MCFFKISQTFKCLDLHCLRQKTVIQSDKGLTKIVEGASLRRHAETSPFKVKDTHLMNNKLPPAEILCGDCIRPNISRQSSRNEYNCIKIMTSYPSAATSHASPMENTESYIMSKMDRSPITSPT